MAELASREPIVSATILRFERSERLLHWAIAVPFMICFGTALVLVVFYNPHPLRPFRSIVSWTHRLSGICLIVFPTLTFLTHRRDFKLHLDNIKQAWIWTFDDLKWLALSGLAAVGVKVALPEQGKFNAGEKLNFMMVMTTYPLYILTGVLIWLPGIAFFSWIFHFSMAAAATPLLLGHIFMATINPSSRTGLSGMISGYVDRRWAEHHYGRWYAERFGTDPPRIEPVIETETPPRVPAVIRCASCLREHVVASWSRLLDSLVTLEPLPCPACGSDMALVSVIAEPFEEVDWILRRLERGGTEWSTVPWTFAAEDDPGWLEPTIFRDDDARVRSSSAEPLAGPEIPVTLRPRVPVG